MAHKKIKVGVLFGGRSAEHEVSLVSATSVIKALDPKKYIVVPIGITKNGQFIIGPQALDILKNNKKLPSKVLANLPPAPDTNTLKLTNDIRKKVNVIFPVLHGTFGEDGTIQSILELAGIPYVGTGVLGSAVGMDKIIQKMILQSVGIPVVKFNYLTDVDFKKQKLSLAKAMKGLYYPVFVKPANAGSSVGISKVHNQKELLPALKLAFKYDRRVIIEAGVKNVREIEVSVLGNERPQASKPGEVIASNEFYDYDAKYVDGKSELVIPTKIKDKASDKIRELACQAFTALDLAGFARIDFLYNELTGQIFLNEANTIPGFTSISMYPKLWAAAGLSYNKLLDELIDLAFKRYQQKYKLITSYQPKKKWYR